MGQKSVLVIEDNEFIVELVRKVLRSTGLTVYDAQNAKKGHHAVMRLEPDLIILDRGLPDGDGNQLLNKLKNDPRTAHIPIMMLTAENRDRFVESSLDLGADDYMIKPFKADHFLTRVRMLLKDKIEREKAIMAKLMESEQHASV